MNTKVEGQMTLGQLLASLNEYDPTKLVMFECVGQYPSDVCSYRGYYEDLAVCSSDKPTTVGDFIKMLTKVNGSCLSGWKGGEYDMDNDTALWVSQEGCASSQAIVHVDLVEYNGSENVMVYTKEDIY